MNSLDKMEDYDRLKQERDEAVAQAAQLKGLAGPILAEVMEIAASNGAGSRGMPDEYVALACALSITPSAALREIQARALEDAKEEFYGYKNHTSDEMFADTAIELLDNLAAAKRKGE